MKYVNFIDLFDFQKKSKIKAGDGKKAGEFPLYTSSNTLSKYFHDYQYSGESIIFGTGGKASVHFEDRKFGVSTDCLVACPRSIELSVKYIYHYISGNMHLLENGFKGAGLKHISKSYISNLEIPLPPLDQQKKIAAILDAADAYRQKTKALISKYDELTQSLFLDMFGDLFKDEKKRVSINEICKFIDYRGKTLTRVDAGIPYITAKSVRVGYFDSTRLDYITIESYHDVMTRGFPKIGDVLFTTEGATMGFTCRIPEGFGDFAVGQRLITLQTNEKYNPVVLEFMLNSAQIQGAIFKLATGSAVKGIRAAKFKTIKIPIPEISLQNQFAERVQAIETQKAKAQESLAKAEDLFASLLQRAFKGELG